MANPLNEHLKAHSSRPHSGPKVLIKKVENRWDIATADNAAPTPSAAVTADVASQGRNVIFEGAAPRGVFGWHVGWRCWRAARRGAA